MRRLSPSIGALLTTLLIGACSTTADVTADELRAVVEQDGVAFDAASMPESILEELSDHDVVLFGETHHLREHWKLVANVLDGLHDDGFRQVLVERPHMNDWLVDDYVLGGELAPGWVPPPYFDRRFTAIRQLNATLPLDERIHVRSIDANEDHSGGAGDFQILFDMLVAALPSVAGIDLTLPSDYPASSPERQHEVMNGLTRVLEENRSALIDAWGSLRVVQVGEMVEVEAVSIEIREARKADDGAAARAREDLIKDLVDRRVAEASGGTLINIGAHHAQKSHLMGTDQEWLGDYLAHDSPTVDGSIIVVGFSAARIELEPGAGGTPFDVEDTSPEQELLGLLAATWPDRDVFLPLTDPLFTERTVAYNSEETIYVTRLGEQFDALIQYGLAHRMPID